MWDDDVDVSPVQPYAARKAYICPGCEGTIPAGTFHLVVVPRYEPDLRRHWHHGCWHKHHRRVGGRSKAAPVVPTPEGETRAGGGRRR